MPLYIGDYLADTRHLTTIQHGAYLLLIMHYWQRGELPADHESLKRIVGLHGVDGENQWRSICKAIAPFFDENWRHKRIDAELKKSREISEKRAMSGRKGGLLNRGKNNNGRFVTQAIAKQRDGQSQSHIESSSASSVPVAKPAMATKTEASPSLVSSLKSRGWVSS